MKNNDQMKANELSKEGSNLSSAMGSVSPGTYHQYDGNNRQDPDNSHNTKHINKFFHTSFRFFNNQTARTTPTIPAEPLIVNSLKNSMRVRLLENIETTGMAANQPAARLVKSPDSTSNTSLSKAQDFIEQINPNISTSDFQYFQMKRISL